MKKNKTIITLFSLLFISELLSGTSYYCEKVGDVVKETICSNKTLSKLDEFLENTYNKALDSTSQKETLITSQQNWLKTKLNACKDDDICLKTEYYLRILEITDSTMSSELSGSYERYYQNKPSFHSSNIDILKLNNHQIYINGIAMWYLNKKNEAKGIVHFGEINGIFPIIENKVRYRGTYGSSFVLTFDKNGFVINESTNHGNWGANVTFDGQYRKIK